MAVHFSSYPIVLKLSFCKMPFSGTPPTNGEGGGFMLECLTPEREIWGRNLPPQCCDLEQDNKNYSLKVLVNNPGSGGSVPT